MQWPEEVEPLVAGDIWRCSNNGPDNTHCLLGWADTQFPDRKCAAEVVGKLAALVLPRYITGFADNPRNSKSKIAKLYNRMLVDIGYDVAPEYL